jgi:hypothetical protein
MNELKVDEEKPIAPLSGDARAVAEVQAAYIIAKRFPRNTKECYSKIIDACKRLSLAEKSMYAFPRGGALVTGPSIRLAEVLAQHWTNCKIGIEILSQNDESTEAKAYACDLENNYIVDVHFNVKHIRHTKRGMTRLTDERDIRELISNIGSRHLRGCILRIIPSDITEDAVNQCNKTLTTNDIPMSEQIKKMVLAFDEVGVKVEHLEKRLGHNLDATIAAEIVNLKAIYRSIKDGMSSREDYFDIKLPAVNAKEALEELING